MSREILDGSIEGPKLEDPSTGVAAGVGAPTSLGGGNTASNIRSSIDILDTSHYDIPDDLIVEIEDHGHERSPNAKLTLHHVMSGIHPATGLGTTWVLTEGDI